MRKPTHRLAALRNFVGEWDAAGTGGGERRYFSERQRRVAESLEGKPMTDELPKLWTLEEVADRTGFALRTLQRDCRAGRIEHVHRGRDRLMTAAQVQKLIEQDTAALKSPGVEALKAVDATRAAAQAMLDRRLARRRG
jgi:hypothetical protein